MESATRGFMELHTIESKIKLEVLTYEIIIQLKYIHYLLLMNN